jgi:hypothetical protein
MASSSIALQREAEGPSRLTASPLDLRASRHSLPHSKRREMLLQLPSMKTKEEWPGEDLAHCYWYNEGGG